MHLRNADLNDKNKENRLNLFFDLLDENSNGCFSYDEIYKFSLICLQKMTLNIDDEIDTTSQDFIFQTDLIVQTFKFMFNSNKSTNSENLKNYIKIVEQLFLQQIYLSDFILEKFSFDFILCFVNYWQNELDSSINALKNDTIKKLNAFFHTDFNYTESLWKSIITHFHSFIIEKIEVDFNKENINTNQHIKKYIYQLIQPLKFCFLFVEIENIKGKVKYYIPIMNYLLKLIIKLKTNLL